MRLTKQHFITGIVFVVVFAAGAAFNLLDIRHREAQRQSTLTEIAGSQAQSIRSHLDHLLSATFTLETALRHGDGKIDDFSALGRDILSIYDGVANVQLAPDGIVRQIYPLKGNEAAIGHNLLKDPKRRKEALRTIKSKKLTLAGPVDLIQGGVAVIGRLPVFLPDRNGEERFWGFTIVLIPLDDLLDVSGIDKLDTRGFAWRLWRDPPDSDRRQVFARSSNERLVEPVNHAFSVPNGTWHLSLSDQKSAIIPQLALLGLLATFFAAALAAFAVHRYLTESERLRVEVRSRTLDLREANATLETDIIRRTRATELSEAINRINAIATRPHITLDAIFEEVIRESTEAIGAENAMITLRDEEVWVVKHVYGYPSSLVGRRLSASRTPELSAAAIGQRPVFIEDTAVDARVDRVLMSALGIRSLIVLPLMIRGQTIGMLCFYYHSGTITFSAEEVDFANKLSVALSLAVENRRLRDTERSILDTLQTALLSVPEEISGLQFGHCYRSATELAAVGGDFYELFELDSGLVGILVGDISGHGVKAANAAALVKNTVRAFSAHDRSPARVMQKVSEVMIKATEPAVFATAVFGIIDVATGTFKYCNAGHPAPLVVKDDRVSELWANSGLLGAIPRFTYSISTTNLEVGDICVIYTDGIIEARRGAEFFGEERLMKAVRELAGGGPEELPKRLVARVEKFTKGVLTDDIVVLAFRLTRVPKRRHDENAV